MILPCPCLSTLPWLCFYLVSSPCLDLNFALRWHCLNLSLTFPCPNLAFILPLPCIDLTLTLPWACFGPALTLHLKLGPNHVSNSWYIPNMDKCTYTNVAWTNVTVTVAICSRCSKEPTFKISSKLRHCWHWVCVVVGWVGCLVVCKVIFVSNPTKVMLGWGWVELRLNWDLNNVHSRERILQFTISQLWQNFKLLSNEVLLKKCCPEKLRPKEIGPQKFGQNLVLNS